MQLSILLLQEVMTIRLFRIGVYRYVNIVLSRVIMQTFNVPLVHLFNVIYQ